MELCVQQFARYLASTRRFVSRIGNRAVFYLAFDRIECVSRLRQFIVFENLDAASVLCIHKNVPVHTDAHRIRVGKHSFSLVMYGNPSVGRIPEIIITLMAIVPVPWMRYFLANLFWARFEWIRLIEFFVAAYLLKSFVNSPRRWSDKLAMSYASTALSSFSLYRIRPSTLECEGIGRTILFPTCVHILESSIQTND